MPLNEDTFRVIVGVNRKYLKDVLAVSDAEVDVALQAEESARGMWHRYLEEGERLGNTVC